MRRTLVALPLMLVLALTVGCGDDDKDKDTDAKSSETTSETTTPSEDTTEASPSEDASTEPSTTPSGSVSAEQFCADAEEALHGGSTSEILQRVAVVVANGLPADMPADAVDGIQVLIDIAPELEKSSTAMKAFQGLSSTQLGNVASLAGYLTTTCGKNLVAELIPALRDLPAELRSLLPSELTAN
ncbi:hypothetical protein [Nocardioides jensenii]|uniref:hypothetical protein n=1 Tax=Nocardioides jensenii TaxID=1843 RepID=UPI000B2B488C|nr:hypothetical protein [Nocardioides jensenii]